MSRQCPICDGTAAVWTERGAWTTCPTCRGSGAVLGAPCRVCAGTASVWDSRSGAVDACPRCAALARATVPA